MRASELRLGNIVAQGLIDMLEVRQGQIDCVRCDGHIIDNPEPAPLTEEWLLRLGFLQSRDKHGNTFHILDKDGLSCMFTVEHWTNVPEDSKWKNHWHVHGLLNGNKLKHVHQLQNLYFALTGEELEINLAEQP